MNLIQRIMAPLPAFFVKLRNIGASIALACGAVAALPHSVTGTVGTVAGYLAGIGAAIAGVSQATAKNDQ